MQFKVIPLYFLRIAEQCFAYYSFLGFQNSLLKHIHWIDVLLCEFQLTKLFIRVEHRNTLFIHFYEINSKTLWD